MRLTQYTDFSLRVLIYLGLNADRRCTIREISEAYRISRNHLMKVVQQLAATGFVRSVRGIGGGLELDRPPGQIVLGEVVRKMEPDFGLVECFRAGNECVITGECALPQIVQGALDAFLAELDRHTLASLLPKHRRARLRRALHIEVKPG